MAKTRAAAGCLTCRKCGEGIDRATDKYIATAAGPMHSHCFQFNESQTSEIHARMMAGYDRAALIGEGDCVHDHRRRHGMGNGILFIDTETTGRPDLIKAPEADGQPRIVQLAAMLTEEGATTRAQFSTLIRPQGWTIPPDAQEVHRICTADCDTYGMPIAIALATLTRLADAAKLIVAHNLEFDQFIVRGEYIRVGLTLFNRADKEIPGYCTMKAATDICRLPGKYPGKFKWPSLAETHRHLFKADLVHAHDAMADVLACAKCYFAMKKETAHVGAI